MLPPVGPDDVRVEALVSGISAGTEMLVYRGQVPADLELDLPTLRGSFSFPIKYGYASVGRIVELGSKASDLQLDKLVFVHHPHQSSYVVPASMPIRLPDGLDPIKGVFLANVETAVNVVLDAAPRIGERVAIFGQGVVGSLIAQLVAGSGAGQVIVVEPVAARRELAISFGAEAFAPQDLPRHVDVDVAIEASGNASALQQAIDALAFGGTLVVCSWYGTKPVSLALGGAFHRRRLRMVSSQVSTIDATLQPRWNHERRLAVARDLLSRLALMPLVSHRFAIGRAAEAYQLIDQHAGETLQVVLEYGRV